MYQACLSQLNIWRLRAVNWFKEEKGANEIIAIILILVVVVALAVLFQDEITDLAESIWDNITDQSSGFTGGEGTPSATERP